VTLRPPELKVVDELFRECELSDQTREQNLGYGSGYLLYQILDRAVDRYFKVLDKILGLMETIEDNVFEEEVEAARELGIIRQDIITQRRVMFPTRALLVDLEKKLKRFSKTDLALFFSDLMDHMNKILDTLDEFTDVIEVFKDADYQFSTYRANRAIRTLALLSALGLPFGVVAAVYVILPSTIDKGSLRFFLLLLIIIFILIGLTLFLFRRRRLI
jgi:magnesium transporter